MPGTERILIPALLLALGLPVRGQEIDLHAARNGVRSWSLDVRVVGAPAVDLLAALAAACELRLDLASPEIARSLTGERLDVHLEGETIENVVALLAMACGQAAEVDLDQGIIRISAVKPPEDPKAAAEQCRRAALDALLVAHGGSADARDEVELLLRSARLQLAGEDYSQACDTYDDFLRKYPSHPAVPEAAVGAAQAAFMAGRHVDVQRVSQNLVGQFPDHPLTGRAQLVAARSRLVTGDLGGGVALLKDLIRRARDRELPQRDGILAELLLAEALHARGDDADAIRGLEETEIRYDRSEDEDLLRQTRLYIGICRHALGNVRDALHDLEVAAFEVPSDALRIRTMLLAARLHLEAGDPFLALTSARVALRMEPGGSDLFETRRLVARAYRDLQLEDLASAEMLDVILEAGRLLPDPELRRREVSASLREIGAIYLEKGRTGDAVASFRAVITAAEHRAIGTDEAGRELAAECRYMIALCQQRAGQLKEAIETLNSITEGTSGATLARDIRRLKGDCYFAAGMPEAAMRVWREGEQR